MTTIYGFSHLATITADLDRYLRFYCDVLGLEHLVTMKMDGGPNLRHAAVAVEGGCILHVFEQPGYDPQAAGIPDELGQRGRLDHFGLMVADVAALEAMAERLVAAGASDGAIRPMGPVWSVHFVDPDGLQCELNCPSEQFIDHPDFPEEWIEVANPDWLEVLAAKTGVPADRTDVSSFANA